LLIAVLSGLPLIGAPPGATTDFGAFWFVGWVSIGALVFSLIRWISRNDDMRLHEFLSTELEARRINE